MCLWSELKVSKNIQGFLTHGPLALIETHSVFY